MNCKKCLYYEECKDTRASPRKRNCPDYVPEEAKEKAGYWFSGEYKEIDVNEWSFENPFFGRKAKK